MENRKSRKTSKKNRVIIRERERKRHTLTEGVYERERDKKRYFKKVREKDRDIKRERERADVRC